MKMKSDLGHYIRTYKDTYTADFCKDLVNTLDKSYSEKHKFYNGTTGEETHVGKDPENVWLDEPYAKQYREELMNGLFNVLEKYIVDDMCKKEGFDWFPGWNGYSFPKFIRYENNAEMKPHCDHIFDIFKDDQGNPRGVPILTMIVGLNEDYYGGDLNILFNKDYKLETGECIVFPSNFLYPHYVKPVEKGRRYSMISWVH